MSEFKNRVSAILAVTGDDSIAVRVIDSVTASLRRYRDTVINYKRLPVLKERCFDASEVRELTIRLDQQKHTAHERLMSDITIANRYLFRTYGRDIPAGGVYTDDPLHLRGAKERHAIETWAMKTVATLQ